MERPYTPPHSRTPYFLRHPTYPPGCTRRACGQVSAGHDKGQPLCAAHLRERQTLQRDRPQEAGGRHGE